MKPIVVFAFLLFFVFCFLPDARSQSTSPVMDIDNANLTATDALGRKLPDYSVTGDSKPGKYVGLFYLLWHGILRGPDNPDSFNVSTILARDPYRTKWAFQDYYWNEPEDGYYRSLDPWVMQRHLQLIAAAGIDFLFLDFTNDAVYQPELTQLCDMVQALRRQGIKAPYIVPFLNAEYGAKVKLLYDKFYKPGRYDDVWFRWQGKPLLLSPLMDSIQIPDAARLREIQYYFTWRPTWALFPPDDPANKNRWRFMDTTPQHAAYGPDGRIEQFVVSKSMGAPLWNYRINGSSTGPGHIPVYDKYWLSPQTGKGYFFNEQWNRADSVQAPILMVTGWNEWKAGAWPTSKDLAASPDFKFEDRKMKLDDMYFVDEFNNEFNRDLEPMKGGYTDNFYYQLVARVRHYKGMEKPAPASAAQTISIDGRFGEWATVTPVYKDAQGDVLHRNHDGVRPGIHYTDSTGRNDIIESRTARDAQHIYFYVKTSAPLTSFRDSNWMLLFIDADHNKQTGWEGYDYVVNASVVDDHTTTLQQWKYGKWKTVARVPYRVSGNELELSIPAGRLRIDPGAPVFNFHWMDNMQVWNDITEFFTHGDSAPERRFDYHYETESSPAPVSPAARKDVRHAEGRQVLPGVHTIQSDPDLVALRSTLSREDSLMKKGVLQDKDTKKFYFTGYDYKTLYDWDQYFESIVQIYMGRPADLIINGVTIFLDHQQESGMIVRSVPGNEFHDREHIKPFLCQIALLVFDNYRQTAWLDANYFGRLKKYLDYWLVQMDGDHNGLSEWMSAPHTGMDNQHERAGWWGDRISEGVDLNCYLVKEMRAFATIAERSGHKDMAAEYRIKADSRAQLIRTLLWDEKAGFFYDHRYKSDKLIGVKSVAGFAPLWAGIATPEQARRMIFGQLMNPAEFWSAWPVPALARSEPGYSERQMANDLGCSWRANTWIPTNYMMCHALRYYGYDQLASLLAEKTSDLMRHAGDREYYHSESGTGTGLDPFWGWSILGHFFKYEDRKSSDITRFEGDGIGTP